MQGIAAPLFLFLEKWTTAIPLSERLTQSHVADQGGYRWRFMASRDNKVKPHCVASLHAPALFPLVRMMDEAASKRGRRKRG